MLDFGEDETGIGTMYMRWRARLLCIDVGASELLRSLRARSAEFYAEVDRFYRDQRGRAEGRHRAAGVDLVVYATGLRLDEPVGVRAR